ncbi:MAG: hypothetical protein ACYCXJ_10190 [Thermoleophilia bacterium]
MELSGADKVPAAGGGTGPGQAGVARLAWRAGITLTVVTGMLHLLNVVEWGRIAAGAALVTPFRVAFFGTWLILLLMLAGERRLPRLGGADLFVLFFTMVFFLRALLTPETAGIALNWLSTATGVYFLVRLGVRDDRDVRVVTYAATAALLTICLFGLVEYAAKTNPLFDAIAVDAVGIDKRVMASSQFYRIRSLVGHPGFAAAMILAGMPLMIMVLRRRRLMLASAMLLTVSALFLTFSRGTWLLGALFLAPLLLARARFWVRSNLKWLAPAVALLALLIAVDYWNQDEAVVQFKGRLVQEGMLWSKGGDGPVVPVADGITPYGCFVYFQVDEAFASGDRGPATVVVRYRDKGLGAIRVDYFSSDRSKADKRTGSTPTASINKTGTGESTVAAFYLEDPVFEGRLTKGADFRVVDDDNQIVIERIELLDGKMKLPDIIMSQWSSRSASFSTRAGLFSFSWSVFRDNPWGVGLFNSPGTGNHAVDSLPLTWLMEFGWLSFLLLAVVAVTLGREAMKAFRGRKSPVALLFLSILLLMMHGGHLMILYDKPSIVMLSSLAAVYAAVRPWRRNGPDVETGSASNAA